MSTSSPSSTQTPISDGEWQWWAILRVWRRAVSLRKAVSTHLSVSGSLPSLLPLISSNPDCEPWKLYLEGRLMEAHRCLSAALVALNSVERCLEVTALSRQSREHSRLFQTK